MPRLGFFAWHAQQMCELENLVLGRAEYDSFCWDAPSSEERTCHGQPPHQICVELKTVGASGRSCSPPLSALSLFYLEWDLDASAKLTALCEFRSACEEADFSAPHAAQIEQVHAPIRRFNRKRCARHFALPCNPEVV